MFRDEYERRCIVDSDIVDHLPRLFAEVSRYTTPQVVELGVRSGNSTSALLAAVEAVGGHVWSVDEAPADVPSHWSESDLWTFVQSSDLDWVDEAPACDVLFIDTYHSFVHTLSELIAFAPKVRPDGVILLHDTELIVGGDPADLPFPVRRAIEAYVGTVGGWSVELVSGCNGLGVLTRAA